MNDSKYDGTLGVGMGLETLRRFIEKGVPPKYTLKVAAFRAQKSAITKRAFLGSSLASGKVGIDGLKKLPYRGPTFSGSDSDGGSLYEVIRRKRELTEDQFADAVTNPFLDCPASLTNPIEVFQAKILFDRVSLGNYQIDP